MATSAPTPEPRNEGGLGPVVPSVEAVHRGHVGDRSRWRGRSVLLRASRLLARPGFVVGWVLLALGWIALNLGLAASGTEPVDPPPFFFLQGAAALTALLVSSLVLVSQEHQRVFDEQRAHLDLEVNLLAEQKIAKLISLIEELRRDLPDVRDRHDPEADTMAQAADPHAVLRDVKQVLGRKPPRSS